MVRRTLPIGQPPDLVGIDEAQGPAVSGEMASGEDPRCSRADNDDSSAPALGLVPTGAFGAWWGINNEGHMIRVGDIGAGLNALGRATHYRRAARWIVAVEVNIGRFDRHPHEAKRFEA